MIRFCIAAMGRAVLTANTNNQGLRRLYGQRVSISKSQSDKLRKAAMSNQSEWRLVAWICRGKSIIHGVNGEKSSIKFKRTFSDKSEAYCCHAEMQVIDKAQATKDDVLYVTRFRKDSKLTMSRPCSECMKHIKRVGIKVIWWTTWEGQWVKEKIEY